MKVTVRNKLIFEVYLGSNVTMFIQHAINCGKSLYITDYQLASDVITMLSGNVNYPELLLICATRQSHNKTDLKLNPSEQPLK